MKFLTVPLIATRKLEKNSTIWWILAINVFDNYFDYINLKT